MNRMNYLAVVLAAVAAFVASSVWYTIFGNAWMELRGIDPATAADMATPAWTMLFVVVQSLVVAFMLAYFVVHLGIVDWKGGVRLGALVWVFPAMILLGSVVHENVPLMLAAIHAGDWLVKLLLMSVILSVWRKGGRGSEGSR
jgi:heme/copper-type cytochrome/quinol oxidase subunit 2